MAFDSRKTLRIKWTKKEKDWMINYPSKPTGWLAHSLITGSIDFKEFVDELDKRGYDTTTLKLSVNKKGFECIKDLHKSEEGEEKRKIFEKGKVYYLKSEEDDTFLIVDDEGYSHLFSKKDGENYFYNFFKR